MTDTVTCRNPDCPDLELFGVQGEYPAGTGTCPKCGQLLRPAPQPQDEPAPAPGSGEDATGALVPLCAPVTSSELAVACSVLQAEGIEHFVHNEAFGALEVGPFIPLLNARTIFVPAADLERAREALRPVEDDPPEPRTFSAGDKLRALVEVLVLGWLIPIRRPRLGGDHEDHDGGHRHR